MKIKTVFRKGLLTLAQCCWRQRCQGADRIADMLLQFTSCFFWPVKKRAAEILWERISHEPLHGGYALLLSKLGTAPKKDWCCRYAVALLTGSYDRSHVRRPYLSESEPLRVTFVAGMCDMRVMRLAAAAQSAGVKVQLVVLHSNRDDMFCPQYFEQVVWIDAWPQDLEKTLQAIQDFGSHLVHCHMQLNFNQGAMWLLASCPLPIIGDAYDMVNVQYNPDYPDSCEWYPIQSELEKIWYRSVEGVCFRSPYRASMKKRRIEMRASAPYIHLPEPLVKASCTSQKSFKQTSYNIFLPYWRRETDEDFKRLEKFIKNFPCELFVIDYLDNPSHLSAEYHPVAPMKYAEYKKFLDKIDIVLMLPTTHVKNDFLITEEIKGNHGNKYTEFFEKNILLLEPEYYKYICNYYCKTNLLISYNADEIFTESFWGAVLKKKERLNIVDNIDTRYFEEFQGQRLSVFYENFFLK